MRVWKTEMAIVEEVGFDHDLHAFEVYSKNGEFLGLITPDNIDDMNYIVKCLNNGECPVKNHWEDGSGNIF